MGKSKTVSRPKIIARDWNVGLDRARAALYKKYYTWITGHDGAFLYEKIIQQLYTAILESGDTCIDVGANKGFHTFPMASLVGGAGKVYAFEPISELNSALVERARRETVNQIEFILAALGSKSGDVEFFSIKNYTPLSGLKLRSPPADAVVEQIKVPLMRLDERIARDARVRFIKIDVEGGELDVIKGGLELIKRSRPIIAFEDGRDKAAESYGYTIDDYFRVFSQAELVPIDILGARIRALRIDLSGCRFVDIQIAAALGRAQFTVDIVGEDFGRHARSLAAPISALRTVNAAVAANNGSQR